MDRGRFVAEAAAVGIDESHAAALHARLFPAATQPVAPAQVPPHVSHQAFGTLSRPAAGLESGLQLTRAIQVLIWLGVMLVIGAHAWWSTSGYEELGYGVVLALTLLWQAGFLGAAEWSRRRGHGSLEAGFAGIVAFYVPLSVYALERLVGLDFDHDSYRGFYEWVSGGWVWMEVVAIIATVALLGRYRRPFLMLPLTLFTGFLLMDATAHIAGGSYDDFDAIEQVVLLGGAVMILTAVALDLSGWRRFAFWSHVVGIWLVGWGLPLWASGARWSLYLSAAIFLALGIWLARMVHLAAGGLMTWIAVSLSADGALLPFVLMGGGITFIALAIWLSQRDSPVRRWLTERELQVPQRDLDY